MAIHATIHAKMSTDTPSQPAAPAILNQRYQLASKLGVGGMATVYRATDLLLERQVAVKVLRAEFCRDTAFRQRFHQEAKAAANLSHPNIVTVHDFGLDQEQLFIVMEYIPGTDLKALLQQRGRFTVDEAIPLLIQACAGLGYAHRAGLIHCDVKPHNFLITADQRLKVTDFGIARALISINPGEKSPVVWGSPQYFAPEQASGYAPTPASDVYALGVIFYELLTGRLPFQAESAVELARMHREEAARPPRQFNPAIPPALETIILKILDKEPTARYRTAGQLGQVLMNFESAASKPAAQPAVSRPTPTHQPLSPLQRPGQPAPIAQSTAQPPQQPRAATGIDWLTWALAFLALGALGGLLPLWLMVYYTYTR
jgi:serine/threonine-protein kinase